MKPSVCILVILTAALFGAGYAQAACNCRQPAYKDEMDYVTSYLACLDECLNAQLQQIRQELNAYGQRISDLEAQLKRLDQRINRLEMEPPALPDKDQN